MDLRVSDSLGYRIYSIHPWAQTQPSPKTARYADQREYARGVECSFNVSRPLTSFAAAGSADLELEFGVLVTGCFSYFNCQLVLQTRGYSRECVCADADVEAVANRHDCGLWCWTWPLGLWGRGGQYLLEFVYELNECCAYYSCSRIDSG